MAVPNSRATLKAYCLRKLSDDVLDVNMSDAQVEDAIDDALDYMFDYHHEFSEVAWISHPIDASDLNSEYIELGTEVMDVLSVENFVNNASGSSESLFNLKYQLRLNDLYDLSSANMSYYYISRQYVSLINDMLNPEIRYTYNRNTRRLVLNFNWADELKVGSYILIEVQRKIDPETYTGLYGNRVLRDMATEMMRIRWGDNLSKFAAIQLPGGITLDGPTIMAEGKERLAIIQEDFQNKYSEPVDFFID